MKLPTEIVTRHKIRDAKIIQMYCNPDEIYTLKDLGSRFKLTASRIQQIVYKNRHLIKIDKDYEKLRITRWLKQQLKKKKDTKRDALDIQDRIIGLTKEDKSINIDASKHQHFTIEIKTDDKINSNPVSLETEDSLERSITA